MNKLNRRNFVKTIALGSTAALLPLGSLLHGDNGKSKPDRIKSDSSDEFSIIHLTDMHVRTKRKGDEGYLKCIQSVNAIRPKPELALMGGDLAFDGLYTEKNEFDRQIDLYKEISDELDFPYYNCLGNHDLLGWSSRRKVPVDDPDIGKKMIMEKLEMETSYYSFDYKGWHFVMLDSLYPIQTDSGPSYEPRIGEEQLDWLAYDLGAAGDKPKICVTHIAAFCAIGQINGDSNAMALTPGMVLRDTKELRHILERHQVKALLQGHSHQIEDYYYNGVWYITSQAVSAAWWGGNWRGFEPGYTTLHCKGNELSWERKSFAWEHYLEPEDNLERERIAEREQFLKEQNALREKERKGIRLLEQVY